MIGGLIIRGSGPKKVLLRVLGPTLGQPPFNVPNAMANPALNLFQGSTLVASNDNWGNATNQQSIRDTGLAPPNALEAAILISLNPGSYTAIVRGVNNTTGNALFEAYDLDNTAGSKFGNISTRSFVQTGNDVMIAGVIGHRARKQEGPYSRTRTNARSGAIQSAKFIARSIFGSARRKWHANYG
jgi:hypothetical protein